MLAIMNSLTQHSFLCVRQTQVLLSGGQHERHHEALHPVGHESQPQDDEESPLEPSVATVLHDLLILFRQLLQLRDNITCWSRLGPGGGGR